MLQDEELQASATSVAFNKWIKAERTHKIIKPELCVVDDIFLGTQCFSNIITEDLTFSWQ
jgi:hypothetical protein